MLTDCVRLPRPTSELADFRELIGAAPRENHFDKPWCRCHACIYLPRATDVHIIHPPHVRPVFDAVVWGRRLRSLGFASRDSGDSTPYAHPCAVEITTFPAFQGATE